MKRIAIYLVGILAIPSLLSCQDEARLELSKRVDVLVKDTSLYDYFVMDFDGVSTFESAYKKGKDRPECKIYYTEMEIFNHLIETKSVKEFMQIYEQKEAMFFDVKYANSIEEREAQPISSRGSDTPLSGMKIALDPVYIGGSRRMAEIERKLLKIKTAQGDTVLIDEGMVNLETAMLAAVKLQKLGAKVFLTRKKIGETGFGSTFFTWMKNDFRAWVTDDYQKGKITKEKHDYLKDKANAEYVYNHYFKGKELKHRAERINLFEPDVTISIGYNIDETNWLLRSSGDVMEPIRGDYSLNYVPGAFMAEELSTPRDRMEFLRLLLTEDYAKSLKLAKLLALQFQYKLGSPPLSAKFDFNYLDDNSIRVREGIYARNLSITRLVHGPVCYAVPLCLDNENEFLAITKQELKMGELITSKRVEQVADALVEGIQDYLLEGRISEDDLIEREI